MHVFNSMSNDQKMFHFFIRTSSKPYDGHYMGPNAKDKYIYIGKYKKDEESGVEVIDEPYRHFSEMTQLVMAKSFMRWYRNDGLYTTCPSGNEVIISGDGIVIKNGDRLESHSFESMEERAKEVHLEEWDSSSREEKDVLVWLEMLAKANYHVKVVPVEFVEYDECVYDALVEMDAANGQIAEDDSQLGPV